MHGSFEVSASTGAYSVAIDLGSFDRTLDTAGDRVILADAYFGARLSAGGERQIIEVDANEASKSLDAISPLIQRLRKFGASRATTLVAIGGGAVQDVAGFVASIYMRGLPWVYMPTTLLGMVDSCIGGKSSINVGAYKNLCGTFYPPLHVQIDPALAETLSIEQRVAGLCEAAKICFARGPEAFDAYRKLDVGVDASAEKLTAVIELSLQSKKWFIEVDEFDRGERLLLNFGHTFGHALESASGFKISHGIAVGLGMITAIDSARGVNPALLENTRVADLRRHVVALLGQLPDLPVMLDSIETEALWGAFCSDKKHTRDAFSIVTPSHRHGLERISIERDQNAGSLINTAFTDMIEQCRALA